NSGPRGEHHLRRRDLLKGVAVAATGSRLSTAQTRVAGKSESTSAFIVADGHGVVETISGRVRGFSERGIYTYLGVPYGAPTGGQARFQPPAKPSPWTGVRDSMQYGPICPQRLNTYVD